MTLAAVANADSTGSHGGYFLVAKTAPSTGGALFGSSNPNTFLFNGSGTPPGQTLPSELKDNDKQVLRVGDTYICPTHGPNQVIGGSAFWTDNSRKIVRQGDLTACGATVTPPVSPEWTSE